MKYRKKPVVVEAVQWDGKYSTLENLKGIHITYSVHSRKERLKVLDLKIKTLEGDMMVNLGDYIIKGVKGEFYPCKPDIFEMTYEPAGGEIEPAETITAKLLRTGRIDNDFDYRRAKLELSRIAKRIRAGCCASHEKAQKLSNLIAEYEERTMGEF